MCRRRYCYHYLIIFLVYDKLFFHILRCNTSVLLSLTPTFNTSVYEHLSDLTITSNDMNVYKVVRYKYTNYTLIVLITHMAIHFKQCNKNDNYSQLRKLVYSSIHFVLKIKVSVHLSSIFYGCTSEINCRVLDATQVSFKLSRISRNLNI